MKLLFLASYSNIAVHPVDRDYLQLLTKISPVPVNPPGIRSPLSFVAVAARLSNVLFQRPISGKCYILVPPRVCFLALTIIGVSASFFTRCNSVTEFNSFHRIYREDRHLPIAYLSMILFSIDPTFTTIGNDLLARFASHVLRRTFHIQILHVPYPTFFTPCAI